MVEVPGMLHSAQDSKYVVILNIKSAESTP